MDEQPIYDARHRRFETMLEALPPREPFPMNYYSSSRMDRNALYVMNQVFPPETVSAVRTQYHRAHLSFEDLHSDLLGYSAPKASRRVSPSY